MDYIAILKADLEKGYSKADLEKLIGLPKNNLSGILKGDRKLSKKSELKIEQWDVSEKPNPLTLHDLVYGNGTKEGQLVDKTFVDLAKNTPKGATTISENPNQQLITQYEEELTRLGTSQIAKDRGKWLTKRIYELKYPNKTD